MVLSSLAKTLNSRNWTEDDGDELSSTSTHEHSEYDSQRPNISFSHTYCIVYPWQHLHMGSNDSQGGIKEYMSRKTNGESQQR